MIPIPTSYINRRQPERRSWLSWLLIAALGAR